MIKQGGNTVTLNNYEKTLLRAEKEFLRFDQQEIIAAGNLKNDECYIYITFFYNNYRIHRHTGKIEDISQKEPRHVTFEEGMSILDAICEPTPFRRLSGDMVDIAYFHRTAFNGQSLHQPYADHFSANLEKFSTVCSALGGTSVSGCDAGFRFALFPFLPLEIKLWEGEEGISPALRSLWDSNTRDFIRYESMFYALGHVYTQITKKMEEL